MEARGMEAAYVYMALENLGWRDSSRSLHTPTDTVSVSLLGRGQNQNHPPKQPNQTTHLTPYSTTLNGYQYKITVYTFSGGPRFTTRTRTLHAAALLQARPPHMRSMTSIRVRLAPNDEDLPVHGACARNAINRRHSCPISHQNGAGMPPRG